MEIPVYLQLELKARVHRFRPAESDLMCGHGERSGRFSPPDPEELEYSLFYRGKRFDDLTDEEWKQVDQQIRDHYTNESRLNDAERV